MYEGQSSRALITRLTSLFEMKPHTCNVLPRTALVLILARSHYSLFGCFYLYLRYAFVGLLMLSRWISPSLLGCTSPINLKVSFIQVYTDGTYSIRNAHHRHLHRCHLDVVSSCKLKKISIRHRSWLSAIIKSCLEHDHLFLHHRNYTSRRSCPNFYLDFITYIG